MKTSTLFQIGIISLTLFCSYFAKGQTFEDILHSERKTQPNVSYPTSNKINNTDAPAGSISVAENSTYNAMTPEQLVQNVLVTGCLTASNVRFGYYSRSGSNWNWVNHSWSATPGNRQLAYFNKATSTFPINEGLILTTGYASSAMGPNNTGGKSDAMVSSASDPDLVTITGRTMYDAAVLEFDFVPAGNTVEFSYVFTSEEYIEYCETNFNDAFGFFLSGPGISGGYTNSAENLAVIPGNIPVSINTIHPAGTNVNGVNFPAENAEYYTNNPANSLTMQFDGGSVVLTATYSVVPCSTYRIKMSVADASDQQWDGAVFLQAKSFNSESVALTNYGNFIEGQNNIFEGCDNSFRITRNNTDISQPAVLDLILSGTATNGVDIVTDGNQPFPLQVTIPANTQYIDIPYTAISDGISDNGETLIIQIATSCPCAANVVYVTSTINIYEQFILNSITATNAQCNNQSNGTISVNVSGGSGSYLYSINNGTTWQSLNTFTGLAPGTYNVIIREPGSCHPDLTGSATIGNPTPIVANAGADVTICSGTSTQLSGGGGVLYSWSPATGLNFTNIANPIASPTLTTEYNLTVTSASGQCPSTDKVIVTVLPLAVAPVSASVDRSVLCNDDNGNIVLTAAGGSGTTLEWFSGSCGGSPVGTGNNLLVASPTVTTTYFARWTNSCGSSGCASVLVNVPTAITASISAGAIACNGGTSTLTVNASGGTGILEYSLNGGAYQLSNTFIVNAAGSPYSVNVKDENNCTVVTNTLSVTEPTQLVFGTPATTNVSCNGGNDGQIVISATGGTGTITYSIIPAVGNQSPSGTFTNLTAQTYTITAEDNNGCVNTINAIVGTEPDVTEPLITCPDNINVTCASDVPLPAPGSIITSDNCDESVTVIYVSDVISNQTCPNNFTITRTYKATDDAGNYSTCSQSITVNDNIAPAVPVNGSSTISCLTSAVTPILPVVTDNCGGTIVPVLLNIVDSPSPLVCEGTRVYTYSYSDCAGNNSNWVYTYTIENEDFTIPANGSSTVACIANATLPVAPAVTDNCGNTLTPAAPVTGGTYNGCEGTRTYTVTYTDCEGNTHDWVYTYTIEREDFTMPANGSSTVACIANATLPVAPAVTDNCGNTLTPAAPVTGGTYNGCEGTRTYTYTYTDCEGNTHDWVYTYTIEREDFTLPANGSSTVACIANATSPVAPAVTDNCGNTLTPAAPVTGGTYNGCEGTRTYTFTYTDCEGNTHDWVYTYTIEREDFTLPANGSSTVACIANATSPVAPAVTDNCGNTLTPAAPVTGGTYNGCEGTRTYTFTYTDCEGNTHDWVYTYTIEREDFTLPANGSSTVACIANATSPVAPAVTDNCGNTLTPAAPVTGGTYNGCEGTRTYTFTYTDCEGNTHDWVYTYTIEREDFTLPANGSSTVACIANATSPVAPAVTDNCGNTLTPAAPVTGGTYNGCEGTRTYTFTYTDCEGNTHDWVYTYTIEREDFTLPANGSSTVACIANATLPVAPAVTDNCGNTLTPAAPVTGGTYNGCEGTRTYTFTYTDCEGNTHDWVYTYTIEREDFTLPANGSSTVACIANATLPVAPAVTDNCGNTLTPAAPVTGGTYNGCEGTRTYTFTYTDCEGNTHDWVYTYTIEREDFTLPANGSSTVACIANATLPVAPAVTDNCGNTLTPAAPVTGGLYNGCEGTRTYTFTYTDCEGNTHDWVYTYTIEREDFTLPANGSSTVACASQITQPIPPIVNDNCGNLISPSGPTVSGDPVCSGTKTYTWQYADCEENTHEWVYTYTLNDNIAPTLTGTLPVGQTNLNLCYDIVPVGPTSDEIKALYADNCNGPVFVTKSGVPTGSNCSWSVTYTYEVKDACNNIVSPSPTVTFSGGDNTNPIVSCPVVPASVWPNSGSNYLNSGIGWDATATDNCSQPTLQYQLSGATQGIGTTLNNVTFNFGSTLVTWTATDGCGRTAVCSYIINVSDNEPPQITCPPTITVSCSTEVPPSYVNYASFVVAGGSANDLSGLDESSFTLLSQTSDGNSCPETITRIYQIADILGNTAQCSQNVIVDDNTAPIFTTIAGTLNRTLQCNDATGIASAQALTPAATDNCDNTLVPVKTAGVFIAGTCPQVGSYTNTWTVTDDCGNISSIFTQIITIIDNTAPVLAAAPAAITVSCIDDVPAMTSLTWTDNCDEGGSVAGVDGQLVGGSCGGTITRTWNVSDACGNPAITRTQIISIDDEIAPVLAAAPAAITVSCIDDVPAMTSLTWTDNCDEGGSVAGVDGQLVGGSCGGTITRTWNVSDACGNPAITRTQIITVDDEIAPVLAAAPAAITVSCIDDVPAMTSLTWTDNCDEGGSVAGVDGQLVGGACGGTITRTWNVSDACGNPAITRTQIITVDDEIAPVLAAAPAAITVSCIDDVPAMTSLTWTDNCDEGGSVAGVDGQLVGGSCGGTITRTWNVSDACGNPAITRTQIITVDDEIAPVLAAAPAAITVSCIGDVPAMTSLTWTDNCDEGGSVAGVDGQLVGGSCGGTITRTWNVSDACGNPAITRTQIITVDDEIAPVLAAAPAAITVSCIDDVPAMTSLTWTDNCDEGGSVAGVDGQLVGGSCGGTITRTWNVSDACGNPAITRTQIITVDDEIAPVLAAAPAAITVSCIDDVPAMTSLTWTDNCDEGGSVAGVDGQLVGGSCGGTITRTWNVSDACGNPAITRTQIITVDDEIAPVLAAAPAAITVSCIGDVPAMTSLTWTDNCDEGGSVAGVDGLLVGGSCGGTITRTWNVSDACGNPAITRTQIITVDDEIAPVLAAAPAAITVSCIDDVPAMTSLTWTDNCDEGGSVAGVDGQLVGGSCGGTITRTWNVSDACGNPAITRTQIITVDDEIAPVLAAAPAAITVSCIDDVPAMTSLTWTDNCDEGGSVAGVDGQLVGGSCGGTITRTWNVSDACGNPAITRTQIITVDDEIAPVLAAAPAAITVSCIGDVPAMTSLTWTDNCDEGGSVAGVDGQLVGGSCGGTITRTWNVSDACGNPAITRTQIITVDDEIAPVLAAAPAAITVSCIDDVPAMTSLTWTDNCDEGGSVAGVDGQLVGGSCGGTITRTWNVSDACGNPAITRTQIITVDDEIAPVLAAAPAAITVSCIDDVPAMTSLTWTDNCDEGGSVAGVDGQLVGGSCGGTITRTWNVSDACGNPAITRTQIITVDDEIAPVLAAAPAAITVSCIDDVPAMTSLTWTDNCDEGGSVAGVDGQLVGGSCGGTITRTWNVSDACGNPAITRTQIITVDDEIAPVLAAAPAAITVSCIDDVPAMTSLTWTDNCDEGGSVAGVDGQLVGGACGGTITRTWNVSDACGNPAITRTQIITVDDEIAPVLAAAPAAITVSCIGDVPAMTSLTWTDNCDEGGSVAGVDGQLVGGACGGTITRTWNVSDACGNPAITRTQIITIDDEIAPVLAAAPAAITVSCIDDVPAMTSLTWTDNCDEGGSVAGVDGQLVGGACGGTITRTWNVSDACGNPAITRTQIITVDDEIAPVLAAAPAAITVSCIGDVPAMTSLTWTDNCDEGGSVAGVDGQLVGGACGGTITRTWNVSDACGNPAITRTQIITVDDEIAPVLAAAPAAITVSCIDDVPAMTSLTWTDNCDEGGSVAGVDGQLVGGACGGTITRTWNVSDACGNPAITRTQIITVDDEIAPVLAAAPAAITVSCIGDVPAMTSLTWTDNCDEGGSVAGVDGQLVGGSCGGTITRTWNVSDACGNPAITRTQIITIDDEIAPVLAAAPAAITVSCIDDVPAMTSLTWTDNCDEGGSVAGVDGQLVGGSCGGTITRTWNVSDACGNPAITRTQIITVDDEIAPVLAAAPAAITVSCIDDVPAMTSLTWTDNCDEGGSVAGVDGQLVGGACGGTITRTWNVSDACGNPAITRTQIITVDDEIAPVLAAAPAAITVSCIDDVPAMTSLTWTDNCDEGGSVAGVDGQLVGGACGGTITRTWNVSDACGNPAITRTQIITVDDEIAPVLAAAPAAITVSCIDDVPAMTSLTWTDNCDEGGSVAGVDGQLVGGACGGTITRTWNVSDACGNPAITRTQIITVDDEIAPVLAAAPAAITVSCIDDVPAMTSLTWTDNCDEGGSVAGVDGQLVGGACGGTITRTWNVSDACGNPAITRTQIITVDDEIAPVLAAAPAAITVSCIDDVPAMTSLTWTDNCDEGGSVAGVDGQLVGGSCGGTITRTWNVSDACGNPAITRTQIITVDDEIAPVLAAAPAAITVSCIDDVPAMTSLTWTDNCDEGGSVAGVDGQLVGGSCGGTITRTWNVSDACGNPAITRTQIITVDDEIAPVLAAAPAAITVSCIDDVPAMTSLTWTDNCDEGGSVAGVDGQLVGGSCGGTITRTWNVSDACGNPAITRTQIITVDDEIAPVLAAAPAAITVSCIDDVPAMTSLTWTDNCDEGGSVAGVDGQLVGGSCGGTITRTWNVSDACGNPAITRTQIITVDDEIAPVLAAAPAAITVSCIDDVPAMTSLTWTDNCDEGGSVAGVDGQLVGGSCGGTITRTWNVSDACGNPAITRTQIITIDDEIAPVLAAAPAAITVSCIDDVPAMTSLTWTDNCDEGGSVAGVDGQLVGGACGGTITRTWNVSDACGNPAITRTQIITVDDEIAPVLAALPAPTTIDCPAVPEFATATATDACDINPSLTFEDVTTPGACAGSYSVTRTWTATDACGNSSTASQTIIVQDITAPVIAALPAPTTIDCPAVPEFATATATDACGSAFTLTFEDVTTPGTCAGSYSVTRTWTATDACGNTSNASQTINVQDITAPVVTCPSDITAITDPGLCGTSVTVPQPGVVENCSSVTLVNSVNQTADASGFYPVGTTQVIWTVADECGNTTTCSMTVTVTDTEVPVITCPADILICSTEQLVLGNATATDNCGVAGITNNAPATFEPGTTLVVWTATDIHGNTSTCTQTVVITPQAVADAGQNELICAGQVFNVTTATAQNYSSLLWTTSGQGTILNASTLNPTYVPVNGETGTIYLTLTASGIVPCASVSDQMVLTILPAPIAIAGPDASICEGQSFTTINAFAGYTGSILWTTSGSGTFTDPTLAVTTYIPGASDITAGSVVLTITSAGTPPCGDASDNLTLTINKTTVAYAGNDDATCENLPYQLTDATAQNYLSLTWTHTGQGTLTGANTLSPTYTPANGETGTITLTLTAEGIAPCGNAVDTKTLTIYAIPTAFAGTDFESCDATPLVLASATATGASGVQWTSSGTGTFENATLVNATYTPSQSDVTNGSVTLTLTVTGNQPCGTASDQIVVTLIPAAHVFAGESTTICSNSPYQVNDATVSGAVSVSWTHDGQGVLENAGTLTPTYIPATAESGFVHLFVLATGTMPCGSVTDSLTLNIIPAATVDAGSDIASCLSAPVEINTAQATNYTAIEWITSGSGTFNNTSILNPVYSPGQADLDNGFVQITLRAIGTEPCGDASDVLRIDFIKAPLANAGPDAALCSIEPFTFTAATAANYNSVSWSHTGNGTLSEPNSLNPTYTPAAGETGLIEFTLTANGTSACGNMVIKDLMILNINPAIVVNAGTDEAIVQGTATKLYATATGGSGIFSYSWTPEELIVENNMLTPNTHILNAETVFTLTVTDVISGCSASDEVTISMGGIQRPIAVNDYDTTGLNASTLVNVTVNDSDPIGLGLDVSIISSPKNGTAILNEDGSIVYTPYLNFTGNDTLTYMICDRGMPSKCATAIVVITIFPVREFIEIYNLVTPNGDGKNDYWHIRGIDEYPDNEVLIFNRWGDKIRDFKGYNNSENNWKGTNENEEYLPDGVYFYILKIKDLETYTGWVYVRGKGDN